MSVIKNIEILTKTIFLGLYKLKTYIFNFSGCHFNSLIIVLIKKACVINFIHKSLII